MQSKETKKIELAPKQKSWVGLAVISIFLVIAIVAGFYIFVKNINNTEYLNAQIGTEPYKLELADTDAKRVKGLSERDKLESNKGMLFDFKQDGDWRMWMVQMRFPIDIAWLDGSKKIIFIKNDARPADFPEKYKAPEPSRYVIEINSGEFERLNIKPGDYVSF